MKLRLGLLVVLLAALRVLPAVAADDAAAGVVRAVIAGSSAAAGATKTADAVSRTVVTVQVNRVRERNPTFAGMPPGWPTAGVDPVRSGRTRHETRCQLPFRGRGCGRVAGG